MTADELRQASGEMRRLAEAATPGPWAWEPPSSESWPMGDESLVARTDEWKPDHYFGGCSEFLREFHGTREAEDGSHEHRVTTAVLYGWGYDASGINATDGDRAHIAAWHPAVALAVANSLIVAAVHIESYECEAHCEPGGCDLVLSAQRTARAFLGTTP